MNAVDVQGLRHVFPPSRRGAPPREALQGLNFSVPAGQVFGLLGPNGGGKTTLFRVLSTGLTPSGGRALVFDQDVVRFPRDVRRRLGVVFQHPSLDKKLTLRENLVHQGRLYGLGGATLRERVAEALSRLRLSDRADERVERLSGGLQRRGEVAKGLLHRPDLLLMDEPSAGLDPGARRDLWEYLGALKRDGMTVLLTTHLMEEAERCDGLAILHEGRCVALGAPSALKDRIGGDVITVRTPSPEELCARVNDRFVAAAAVVDGSVRLERRQGHAFLPQLVEAFPGLIESVSVGKPTLEDVFIHETGRGFGRKERPA